MAHVRELLQHDLPQPELTVTSTGFAFLDDALGGLRPGRVLLVASSPGQGKTTYAVQVATAAALSGRRVRLKCPRESKSAVAARVLASTARVNYERLLSGRRLDTASRQRARAMSERLLAVDLDVCADEPVDLSGVDDCDLLVVDDAHLGGPAVREGMRRASQGGTAVVATVPLDLLVRDRLGLGTELQREWAEICDHAIAFVWPEAGTDREGEADLLLLKNRHGPLLEDVVAFQGLFARYVDLDHVSKAT